MADHICPSTRSAGVEQETKPSLKNHAVGNVITDFLEHLPIHTLAKVNMHTSFILYPKADYHS